MQNTMFNTPRIQQNGVDTGARNVPLARQGQHDVRINKLFQMSTLHAYIALQQFQHKPDVFQMNTLHGYNTYNTNEV